MSILGVAISLLVGGLGAADLAITVGEMATQGAFIRPEIADRRVALQLEQAEAIELENTFHQLVVKLQNDSGEVEDSYDTNKQIMSTFGSHFENISRAYQEYQNSGIFELIRDGAPPPPQQFVREYGLLNYLYGSGAVFNDALLARTVYSNFQTGNQFTQEIKLQYNNLRDLHGLKLSNDPAIHAQRFNKIFNGRFGVKRPRLVSGYKMMKSVASNYTTAALSAVSIGLQVANANNTLAELNAALEGIRQYKDMLRGESTPHDDDYKAGVNEDSFQVVYNIPQVQELNEALATYAAWDFEQFQGLVGFIDLYFRQGPLDVENLLVGPSQRDEAAAFLGELVAEIYTPGLRHADSGCRENIADAQAYTLDDMRCVQNNLKTFITQEGVTLVAAMAASPTTNIPLARHIEAVQAACGSPFLAMLPAESLFCFIRGQNVPVEAIALELEVGGIRVGRPTPNSLFNPEIITPYNGLCNGKDFFVRDASGAPTEFKYASLSCF